MLSWSSAIQADGPDLWRIDGKNFYPDKDEHILQTKYDPDMTQSYIRVEHQTLIALPKSRTINFCVRGYMTSLYEIKAEGRGRSHAAAVKSMQENLGD